MGDSGVCLYQQIKLPSKWEDLLGEVKHMNTQQFMGNNAVKVNLDLKSPEYGEGYYNFLEIRDEKLKLYEIISKIVEIVLLAKQNLSKAVIPSDYVSVKNGLVQATDACWSLHHYLSKDGSIPERLEKLNDKSPSSYQWFLKFSHGYCAKHDEVYQEIIPNEYMCESCIEETSELDAYGWCGACRKQTKLVEGTNYCRPHYEAFKDEVQS